MAERIKAEHGLVDAWTAGLGGPRTAALLDRLDQAVPWSSLVRPVAALPEYNGGQKGGRPAGPALTMPRCVLLAKWCGVSDPQLEECLRDRLGFRRFVGLSLTDATPDETTFVRFRARLREARLDRTLFDTTLSCLESQSLLVRDGMLVDAKIIEQSRGRKRADGTCSRDPEALFTRKNGETCHGYKRHIAADTRGIVKDYRSSDAAPHDSNFIDELTADETRMVVADSAYRSAQREKELGLRGVCCAISFKRKKGQAGLPPLLKKLNGLIASVRALVEHPFAWMKNMGYRRVRYRGKRRNELDFALNLIAYNWKRSLSRTRARA